MKFFFVIVHNFSLLSSILEKIDKLLSIIMSLGALILEKLDELLCLTMLLETNQYWLVIQLVAGKNGMAILCTEKQYSLEVLIRIALYEPMLLIY